MDEEKLPVSDKSCNNGSDGIITMHSKAAQWTQKGFWSGATRMIPPIRRASASGWIDAKRQTEERKGNGIVH